MLFVHFIVLISIFFYLSCIQLNQVAVEVERDEDEGGMVGETFTDYVSY